MKESVVSEERREGRSLSFLAQSAYALGNFGVAFSPTIVAAWLGYFFYGQEVDGKPLVYLAPATFSAIWFATQFLNAFTDPVVGFLSDHTRSRFGRRRPWILIGAPLLGLCFFFLWTPATREPSLANAAILFFSLLGFWLFFTVVVAPYLALLPEITPFDNERVRISTFMGIHEVLGTAAGNILPPVFAGAFASGALFLTDGYQVTGLLGALALMVCFLLAALSTRERYRPPEQQESAGRPVRAALREFASVFRNPAFLPYVLGAGFYRMAAATIVFVTPFVATKILGAYPATEGDLAILGTLGAVGESQAVDWELAAGYLMMLVLVGAALLFPLVSLLSRRMGKRALYILSLFWLGIVLILMSTLGLWPYLSPLEQALCLFALATFPLAVALVIIRPILADVIDTDEKLTGRRREGIYNGMEGLIQKTGAALGPGIAGLLFQFFGGSAQDNLGIRLATPLAGLCLLAAALAFTRYPIRK